jgi:hypothetical protein
MPEEAFRFLSNEEFEALEWNERAAYLARATQELEARRQLLHSQAQAFAGAPKPAPSITPSQTAPQLD